MNKLGAINFLIPPRPYLWQWDPEGTAIEWAGESTVCVWEELHALLHYLAPHGLPPLGSLLMVLMACRQKASLAFSDALRLSSSTTNAPEPSATSRRLLLRLKEVLERVQALPEDLRTGLSARAHLLRTLFEGVDNRQPPDVSALLLDQIDIWGPADLNRESPRLGTGPRLLRDLKALATVYEQRDLPRLEALLRTGLDDVDLRPASVPEPESEPGASNLPLLRQLEEHRDSDLASLGAAARRIVAMFSLPRPAGFPQELPVGGISDITNRGPLDRLLPGELAYDDLTLSARLANNEALYFRRDTPPDEPATERLILMDSGVHLWGTPRIFALAAALGLQSAAGDEESVSIFRRDGHSFRPYPLQYVAHVHAALTSLPAAPDPEEALTAFTFDEHSGLRPDVFFLSVPQPREAVRQALHALALRTAAAGGRFYSLTVSRTGALELSTRTAAGSRVLASGRIDPDSLFRDSPATPDKPAVQAKDRLTDLPEIIRHLGFYKEWPLPFFFPVLPGPFGPPLTFRNGTSIRVTPDRRLMIWKSSNAGGMELGYGLPVSRQYWTVNPAVDDYVVIVSGTAPGDHVRAAAISGGQGRFRVTELDSSHPYPTAATVMNGAAILGYTHKVEACSLEDGRQLHSIALPRDVAFSSVTFDGRLLQIGTPTPPPVPPQPPAHDAPQKALPEIIRTPISAGFDSSGHLLIRAQGGIYELTLPELLWKKTPKSLFSAARPFSTVGDMAEIKADDVPAWHVAEWNADCRLIFDTRGLLHIVFHDMHGLVELTVLCLINTPTAVWGSHWPAGKRYAGAKKWMVAPQYEPQPLANLTALLQRFVSMALSSPQSEHSTFKSQAETYATLKIGPSK